MWRKTLVCAGGAIARQTLQVRRAMASLPSSSTASYAVNNIILRSLKDHYQEISKMTPPPKISPPSPYTVVKGALDSGGPVLNRHFKDEEINISVMRLVDLVPSDDNINESINQLFVHVDISKPGLKDSLHFLCGLYPDALGIHSVSLRQKSESSGFLEVPKKYTGPVFEEVDEKLRDTLHGYIDERGINESLFPFLQAWLYVKDHRDLMRWFKTVGTFVSQSSDRGTVQA
ncbi:mitochondrial acidic protein mam33 [Andrographis paniculata]|uniref:mitochondrial acidic protein mam33 n=1 Tax=Andrographis paniculata TaxID=175694 RepID=UPI0021E7C3A5|nr:mitochondrial acidic protein mam33 [Andrographis paniculata]